MGTYDEDRIHATRQRSPIYDELRYMDSHSPSRMFNTFNQRREPSPFVDRTRINQQPGVLSSTFNGHGRMGYNAREAASPLTPYYTATRVPLEFKYNYGGDNNGALYYIATKGKTSNWMHPENMLRQIRSFVSSVYMGRPADVQDRMKSSGVCTQNIPFSFYGFMFGYGRKLLPSCYSFSQGGYDGDNFGNYGMALQEQMLSWRLEGSNDMQNWFAIDTRH